MLSIVGDPRHDKEGEIEHTEQRKESTDLVWYRRLGLCLYERQLQRIVPKHQFEYTLEEHLTHSNSHVQSNLDYLYQAKILDD